MKFAFGPMSSETIRAVYEYSHENNVELMLIASKNQIDYDGGYVNNWNTREYVAYLQGMKDVYRDSKVLICRDHCGPGFRAEHKTDCLIDTIHTIKEDCDCNFDLLHIDLSRFDGDIINGTLKCLEFAREQNPNIQFEIGTDEIGKGNDLQKIEKELEVFHSFDPLYYVVNTGSLVKENYQAGRFNVDNTLDKVKYLARDYGIGLKEHNADYLNKEEIFSRVADFTYVDAMNIAPQLGVVQTMTVLTEAMKRGVNVYPFVDLVYNNKKWEKWEAGHLQHNPWLATAVAGHYHYTSDEYNRIIDEVNKGGATIQQKIVNNIYEVIHHYVSSV